VSNVRVERVSKEQTGPSLPSGAPNKSTVPVLYNGDAYRVTGIDEGLPCAALVRLRSVKLSKGAVRVQAEVPYERVEIPDRPVAAHFLGTIGSMFGAKWIGEQILSAPLKRGIRWDGQVVTAELPIPDTAPQASKDLEADMDVVHVDGGLRFVFGVGSGSAEAVLEILVGAARERQLEAAKRNTSAGGGTFVTSMAWSAVGTLAGLAETYFGVPSTGSTPDSPATGSTKKAGAKSKMKDDDAGQSLDFGSLT